jgi:hypothetical protein
MLVSRLQIGRDFNDAAEQTTIYKRLADPCVGTAILPF